MAPSVLGRRTCGRRASGPKLLPVIVSDSAEQDVKEELDPRSGSIHVEFPGRALVSIEAGVEPALATAVIERLAR